MYRPTTTYSMLKDGQIIISKNSEQLLVKILHLGNILLIVELCSIIEDVVENKTIKNSKILIWKINMTRGMCVWLNPNAHMNMQYYESISNNMLWKQNEIQIILKWKSRLNVCTYTLRIMRNQNYEKQNQLYECVVQGYCVSLHTT